MEASVISTLGRSAHHYRWSTWNGKYLQLKLRSWSVWAALSWSFLLSVCSCPSHQICWNKQARRAPRHDSECSQITTLATEAIIQGFLKSSHHSGDKIWILNWHLKWQPSWHQSHSTCVSSPGVISTHSRDKETPPRQGHESWQRAWRRRKDGRNSCSALIGTEQNPP